MFRDTFEPDDDCAHLPPDDDARWQESFCIVWHDPRTKSGGNHHFSLWRNQRRADIWSWVVLDGVEVAREQVNETPIPDDDFTDFSLGGIRLRTHGDLRTYTVGLTYPGVDILLEYSAYSPPIELDFARGGASLGKRHIETLGAVDVTVKRAGEPPRKLDAVAFQDHSWGNRELGRNPAGQFLFAVFGPDLMVSAHLRQTMDGLDQDGWFIEGGRTHHVTSAEISASVGNGGLYPVSGRCDLWSSTGGLRLDATCQATAVEGGIGLLAGDGLMVFECGGRLGGGLLELKPLREPLPIHRKVLNLPEEPR